MNKRQKKKSIKKRVYLSFLKPSFRIFPSYYSDYKKIRSYFNKWECCDKQLRKVKRYRMRLAPRNFYKL